MVELQQRAAELSKLCQLTPDREVEIEYLHTYYAVLEKEHNMYARLSLCDNEEAKEFKAHLDKQAREAGLPPDISVPEFCAKMKEDVKKKLSEMGQDITDINEDFFL